MKVEKSTVDQTATAMRVDDFNIRKGDYLILEFCVKANMTVTNGLRVMMFNQSGGGLVLDKYWTPTTSWKNFSRVQRFTSESTWALRVVFYFQKTANWTCYFDTVMYRVPEVGIQRYVTGEAAVANGQNLNFTEAYFNDKQETINSTVIVNGETVSHSGTLTNGTESSATSLTGILTGAVRVDANIQGSGQAILKITGTRVLYEGSIILKGRTSGVYYGRYYETFSPTTTTSDLIAVTNLQANITTLTHSSNKLTLTIDSPSGTTSTTKVCCGDKCEPTSVQNATSWSYNNTSKILTTTVTHSSPINVTVKWRFPGDVNDDGIVDASDLFNLSKVYGCKFGDPNWSPDCDFNRDNKVDASDLSDLNKNYGKTS